MLNDIALTNHLRATERHCRIRSHLPTDTSERTRPNPSESGRHSINLPRRDGRL